MIDLYQFPPLFDIPNLSPFCMKVEGFLRIADIPFQIIDCTNPRTAPKGKLPFIRDNGISIGDSELIMDYLESKLDFKVDGHLDSQQRAMHHATIRMLDEHLYWALVYSRWIDDNNWPTFKARMLAEVPPPISTFIGYRLQKQIRRQLDAQGLGRHNREEIYGKATKDIAQLSTLLSDHTWFGGDYISKLDLTVVGILANILIPELSSPLSDAVKIHGNLERYFVRAQRIIFPPESRRQEKKPAYLQQAGNSKPPATD